MSLSDILAVASLILAIVAIPVTYWLARRTRQRSDLRFVWDFDVLINAEADSLPAGVVVSKDGRHITSLSRTRLAIWNHRGDAIERRQIVDSDPLRIQFDEDDSIVQVRTLRMSRTQTGFLATVERASAASVLIEFDFLDVGDGAILEVIHQASKQPQLMGTLLGADIRNRGSMDLSTSALMAASEASPVRRLFIVLKRRSSRLVALGGVVAGILASIGVAAVEFRWFGEPRLVAPSAYDLTSLRGQKDFASAVSSWGIPDKSSWMWFVTTAGYLGLLFFMVKTTIYRPYPQQILNHESTREVIEEVEVSVERH